MAVSFPTPCSSLYPNRPDFVVLYNLVDDVHPPCDLSENGVDAVQVWLGRVTDEKLAPPRVLPGMRHGERPPHVPVDVLVRLAFDHVAGAARADAALAGLGIGVAALDHEVRN